MISEADAATWQAEAQEATGMPMTSTTSLCVCVSLSLPLSRSLPLSLSLALSLPRSLSLSLPPSLSTKQINANHETLEALVTFCSKQFGCLALLC